MKRLSGEEIKKREFQILLYFRDFCKDHHLRFSLAGGTLLGAIRHKGFIPWDDDIDVCMPRSDYQRFIKEYSAEQSKYMLVSNQCGNLNVPYSALRDQETVVKSQFSEITSSLWIDIFPVDGLPDNMEKIKQIYHNVFRYRTVLMLNSCRLGEGRTVLRKYSKFILKPLAKLYGVRRCIQNMERLALQYPYDQAKFVGAITWGLHGMGEKMLKSEFEKMIEVDFEGEKFPAFSCWDSYLTGLYGDYMKLPPIEERRTHDMVVYLKEGS